MLKTVDAGQRLKDYGIRENHRGYPQKPIRVFGADTETCQGKVYSLQMASEGEEVLLYTTPDRAFKDFTNWVTPRLLEKGVNIVFFHNLRFDATVIFTPEQQTIYNQYTDIRFERDGYKISMFYGRVNFVRVWQDLGGYQCPLCGDVPSEGVRFIDKVPYCANPKHGEPTRVKRNLGTVCRWTDSAAFCPPGAKSLESALKIYGVPYKKMPHPEGLGERELSGPEFEAYAMNDARATEALGRKILDLHKEYDITPSISLPQLAGRILRHHFFNKDESFPFPPEKCQVASELSYHAGKNGFYVAPGSYDNLYEYDINSAFPRAMREMPQMVKGTYAHVKKYHAKYLGVYRIRGKRLSGKYPIVFDHAFRPIKGAFHDVWVTGYEIAVLKSSPFYRFKILEGWIWRHDQGYAHSPLASFVDKFWHLKNTTPKGPKRDTYKNILNSLYGKFAACTETREFIETSQGEISKSLDGGKRYAAGALYHPFIATQITGFVRAELFKLEISGAALHAATDSVKSYKDLPTSEDLGGIKKEVYGRCYLFRNKLYLHFAVDTALCGHKLDKGWLSVTDDDKRRLRDVGFALETGITYDREGDKWWGKLFDHDGQHLCKAATHGFKSSVFELYFRRDELIQKGYIEYDHPHMVNLREGIKRGETVCHMIRRREMLVLDRKNTPLAKVI